MIRLTPEEILRTITNWSSGDENHKLSLDVQFERVAQAAQDKLFKHINSPEVKEKIIEWHEEKYYRADVGIPVEFEDEFEERKLRELDQIIEAIVE
ncbi:hypothetical protein LCGC14_1974170 [marine sediment metagenome]|uniref:Uncharacterized protein n=1 Tax=marine sediment metagenome TaxID=412755 RepID=A0A0F9FB81_9ZZZZ